MTRRATALRWARRVLTVLVLGAATTVAVAWGLSYRAEGNIGRWTPDNPRVYTIGWTAADGKRGVATVVQRHWRGVVYFRIFRRSLDDPYASDPHPPSEVAPGWSAPQLESIAFQLADLDESDDRYYRGRRERSDLLVGAGWPWPAIWCHAKAKFTLDMAAYPENSEWDGPGVDLVVSGALSVQRGKRAADDGWSILQPDGLLVPLPYLPLWRGAAANTLIFSAAWTALWILAVAPFRLRRYLRLRRHLCPRCAYDLRGAVSPQCPECGHPIPPPALVKTSRSPTN